MQKINENVVNREGVAHPESPASVATAEDEIRNIELPENLKRSQRDQSVDELFPIE